MGGEDLLSALYALTRTRAAAGRSATGRDCSAWMSAASNGAPEPGMSAGGWAAKAAPGARQTRRKPAIERTAIRRMPDLAMKRATLRENRGPRRPLLRLLEIKRVTP